MYIYFLWVVYFHRYSFVKSYLTVYTLNSCVSAGSKAYERLIFSPMGQQPLVSQDFISEASQSHSDTSLSVGLPWTSDQPDAETSTWQHSTHKRQKSMPSAGFELIIPASERPQADAVDRAATGIGERLKYFVLFAVPGFFPGDKVAVAWCWPLASN
jgi:hypothetical protein